MTKKTKKSAVEPTEKPNKSSTKPKSSPPAAKPAKGTSNTTISVKSTGTVAMTRDAALDLTLVEAKLKQTKDDLAKEMLKNVELTVELKETQAFVKVLHEEITEAEITLQEWKQLVDSYQQDILTFQRMSLPERLRAAWKGVLPHVEILGEV